MDNAIWIPILSAIAAGLVSFLSTRTNRDKDYESRLQRRCEFAEEALERSRAAETALMIDNKSLERENARLRQVIVEHIIDKEKKNGD